MSKQLSATSPDFWADKPKSYLLAYEMLFAPMVDKEVKLLELGVYKGASLLMWRDYLSKGTIVGLDVNAVKIDDPTGRIHTYQGYQEDTDLLTRIAHEWAPNGFDVIIDDCSHIGELTRISFWHLFAHHLKPGGIYAIEDWGTGYFGDNIFFPDGRAYRPGRKAILSPRRGSPLRSGLRWLIDRRLVKHAPPLQRLLHRLLRRYQYTRRFRSHDYGMVGFVKELVDECGMGDITDPKWGKPPWRPSRISKMQVSPGLVIVFKAQQ